MLELLHAVRKEEVIDSTYASCGLYLEAAKHGENLLVKFHTQTKTTA
jgi:hypothetical protein